MVVTVGVTVGVIVAEVPIDGVIEIVAGGVLDGVGVGETVAVGVGVTGIPNTENLIAPSGIVYLLVSSWGNLWF